MMDEDVVRPDRADHLAIVGRQVLEPAIRRFDEDLRVVPGAVQRALDTEDFVPDGVAVAERREDLVDASAHADCLATFGPGSTQLPPAGGREAPRGIRSITSTAGGRSRVRRASHPGSGSRDVRPRREVTELSSRFSRANMSRYL